MGSDQLKFNFEKYFEPVVSDRAFINRLVHEALGTKVIDDVRLKALRTIYGPSPAEKRLKLKLGSAAQVNYAVALGRKIKGFPYSMEELTQMTKGELTLLISFLVDT